MMAKSVGPKRTHVAVGALAALGPMMQASRGLLGPTAKGHGSEGESPARRRRVTVEAAPKRTSEQAWRQANNRRAARSRAAGGPGRPQRGDWAGKRGGAGARGP